MSSTREVIGVLVVTIYGHTWTFIIWFIKANSLTRGIKRGDDGRLHIPRDLTDRYGSVSTYSIIDGGDFDGRWAKSFSQECTYRWETFQKPVEMLAEERFSRSKVMLLFPANVMGNTGELSARLEPNFTQTLFGDLKFKPEFIRHSQETLHRIKKEHLEKLHKRKSAKKRAKSKKNKSKEKPLDNDFVFVGIHCRRTDHLAFERDQVRRYVAAEYVPVPVYRMKTKTTYSAARLHDLLGPRFCPSKSIVLPMHPYRDQVGSLIE